MDASVLYNGVILCIVQPTMVSNLSFLSSVMSYSYLVPVCRSMRLQNIVSNDSASRNRSADGGPNNIKTTMSSPAEPARYWDE